MAVQRPYDSFDSLSFFSDFRRKLPHDCQYCQYPELQNMRRMIKSADSRKQSLDFRGFSQSSRCCDLDVTFARSAV